MLLDQPITTKRLLLKNLNSTSIEGPYLSWCHDAEVNQYLELRHRLPNVAQLKWYVDQMNESKDRLLLGIHLLDDRHIGNITLSSIHFVYARATLGLMIGDKMQWGKGYATEAISALSDFAFNQLDLSAVWAGCYANNLGSYKAFLKAGFQEEGRQSRYWMSNDKFVDNILLVKFKDGA